MKDNGSTLQNRKGELKESLNKKLAMLIYVTFTTMVVGLLPTLISILVPRTFKWLYITLMLLFSIFFPIVIFIFTEEIKEGFRSISLGWKISLFCLFLLTVVGFISWQILQIF